MAKQEPLEKKSRKIPKRPHVQSRQTPARKVTTTLVRTGESNDSPAAFDPGTLLAKLVDGKSTLEYRGGESIFSQGDLADSVFYVQKGKVKLSVVSEHGREAVLAILSDGSFLGESCLAGRAVRLATASTIEPSTVIRVGRQEMISLLHRETEFAEGFVAYLLSRNIRMEADLVDHLFNSSEKRLARLLLLLANFGKESRPMPVITKVNQETLAEMVGTTRSRVSHFLNRFRDLGFIDYNSEGMQVHSSLISVVIHD